MFHSLFSFLFFFFFIHACEASTIHAILVADNINNITYITNADIKSVSQELKVIAKNTQMVLKEKVFSDYEFRRQTLQKYLKNLKVEKNDVVFFYFSGHGYHTRNQKTPWPMLVFTLNQSGMDLQWVLNEIKTKKPRLSLILADCCNNYLEYGFDGPNKNVCINLSLISPCYEGYCQLFKKAKGRIVVCSSSPGQFSYGSHLGGLYTHCFLMSLNQEIAKPKPSWKRLLEQASHYIRNVQTPVCEIHR